MTRIIDVLSKYDARNKEIWVRYNGKKYLVVKYNTTIPIVLLYRPCSVKIQGDLILFDIYNDNIN